MSNDLEKYSKHIPKGAFEDGEYSVVVLDCSMMLGKFYKPEKLSMDQRKEFAKLLNDKYVKEVINPFMKSIEEFCEKYEVAPMLSDIKTFEPRDIREFQARQSFKSFMDKAL